MQFRTQPCVLCLDDDATECSLLREVFTARGFDVLVAQTWPDAKKQLSLRNVEAVILDYRLVGESGVEVAIEIRKFKPRVPIILLSGFLQDVPEYFKRAADAVVAKSSPHDVLVKEVLGLIRPDHSITAAS